MASAAVLDTYREALNKACDFIRDDFKELCPRNTSISKISSLYKDKCSSYLTEDDCKIENGGECWREYFVNLVLNKVE